MEFDKSKVYTALNADELKVGSKCIFADTVKRLSELVESDNIQKHMYVLRAVLDDDRAERFEIKHTTYSLAYLVEPPKEPQYKPFSTVEKAMEAIRYHGGWVQEKSSCYEYLIIGRDEASIRLGNDWICLKTMFTEFTFADDGSPCGELAEE